MIQEMIWKDVVGYEGYYIVSNKGVVKSVDRVVPQGVGLRRVKGKIKALNKNPCGYPCVTLCKDCKSRAIPIHIILAKAFIPNPENKPYIDHIDTDKENFSLDNLRWVTPKENANNPLTLSHCRENTYTNEVIQRRLETSRAKGNKTAPRDVYQYDLQGNFIARYKSSNDAERATQINATAIRGACKKQRYSAGGFLWSYQMGEISYDKPTHTNAKKVLQYDKNGKFIREWASLADVCKVYGSTSSNLSKRIARGKFRGIYIWKFKE